MKGVPEVAVPRDLNRNTKVTLVAVIGGVACGGHIKFVAGVKGDLRSGVI